MIDIDLGQSRTTFRKRLNIEWENAIVGNGNGVIIDPFWPGSGRIYLRFLTDNGYSTETLVRGPSRQLATALTDGLNVKVKYDAGEPYVDDVDVKAAIVAGVYPVQNPPSSIGNGSGATQDQLSTLRCSQSADQPSLIVYLNNWVAIINNVANLFPGDSIDLTSFVPSAGLHCCVVIFVKNDYSTTEVFASTPIGLAEALSLDDLNEALALSSSGSTPAWSYDLKAGATAVLDTDTFLDARQLVNVGSNTTPGDVTGPGSATDNAVARFDGTSGKQIQNSGVIIDDSDNILIPGIETTQSGKVRKTRVVTAAGAVTVATSDDIVVIDKASGAATTVNLPGTPTTGQTFVIHDGKGDAATNNITITPAAGNINGVSTLVLNIAYASAICTYNGTQWDATIAETGSGGSGDVTGPGSSTAHDLAAFADTTGKVLEDSGVSTANVAKAVAALADKFLLQTPDATNLPNAQAMSALATGLVKNTTTTGVQSIATAGTDYTSPTGTENLSNKTIAASSLIATALSLLIGGFKAIFTHANTADRTYTFPDKNGTVAMTSDIPSVPLTTKGDLLGFDTADARVPIGTNNQVLTADSGQSLGLKWALLSLVNSVTGLLGLANGGTDADLSATGPGVLVQASSTAAVTVPSQIGENYLGTAWKIPCRLGAQANVNIASPGSTFDGITAAVGNRIFLGVQATASQNGIWVYNGASSPMTRPTDFASGSTVQAFFGIVVAVTEGNTLAGYIFRLTTTSAITIDTSAIDWTLVLRFRADALTGTVPVANGGTNVTSLDAHKLLVGGGSFLTFLAPTSTNDVVYVNGSDFTSGPLPVAAVPNLPASIITSGTIPAARLGVPYGVVYFGDGTDGNLTASSGTTTLTRDTYYNNVTLSGTAKINTAGYRLFVAGTLNLTNAGADAIFNDGATGANASTFTGGSSTAAVSNQTVAGCLAGTAGSNGRNGTTGAGTNGVQGAAASPGNGGAGGASGNGGASSGGVGGTSASGGTVSSAMPMNRWCLDTLRATSLLLGGASGAGGGSGGAAGGVSGGGGQGGNGGGVVWISANTITRVSGTTAASCISAVGGAGGNGASSNGANTGDGGGGGGGGGGWIYLAYGALSGSSVTNMLDASGGAGGNAGAAGGTVATVAAGGTGGSGGRITIVNLLASTTTETTGNTGTANTGRTGGPGNSFKANL